MTKSSLPPDADAAKPLDEPAHIFVAPNAVLTTSWTMQAFQRGVSVHRGAVTNRDGTESTYTRVELTPAKRG